LTSALSTIDSEKPTFPQFYGGLTPIENKQSIHCIALDLIAGGFMRQYSKEFIYSVCLKPFTTEFKPVAEIFSFTIH